MQNAASRSMKNGSSRGPAKTCMPLERAERGVERAGDGRRHVGDLVLHRAATGGATGPRTSTCWSAPSPVKVTWMTLSSMAVAVVVDLELVEQVVVERRLRRVGGLRRREKGAVSMTSTIRPGARRGTRTRRSCPSWGSARRTACPGGPSRSQASRAGDPAERRPAPRPAPSGAKSVWLHGHACSLSGRVCLDASRPARVS